MVVFFYKVALKALRIRETADLSWVSFLRLSVRTKQLDMVNLFIKLYKPESKPKISPWKRWLLSRLERSEASRGYDRTCDSDSVEEK